MLRGTDAGWNTKLRALDTNFHGVDQGLKKKNTIILKECSNIFIIVLNINNNLICITTSSMFNPFKLGGLEKLDLEVLEFWIWSELAIW